MSTPALDRHEVTLRPQYTTPRLKVVGPDGKPRYGRGWRRDKPVEDPEKTKRWGFVTAKPSEYLIHMRRGRILREGRGVSCFKWPRDSVSIVPTTINRLQFAADQVTREKVGVEVIGLAVYRISKPRLAARMLNFSYTERASEKLEEILGEMFVGATRRIVANLDVHDVLSRRKSGLAEELMAEIAPIVQGTGRAEDDSPQGWGIVIDTIEVQDIRVLSDEVFSNMQAQYRTMLDRQSNEARLETAKAIALREVANQREIAAAQQAILEVKHANMRKMAEQKAEIERLTLASRAEIRQGEIEMKVRTGEADNQLLEERRRIENSFSDERIRMEMVSASLPAIAQAFAHKFGEVHLTNIGSGGGATDPNALIAGVIKQILEVARAVGVDVTSKSSSTSAESASE